MVGKTPNPWATKPNNRAHATESHNGHRLQQENPYITQRPQGIQLLVVVFGASPDARFADLGEPFRTVTWCVPVHDPEILGDG